ncbi:uncharacterized protein B0J16DRAFT_410140 [Fusarium flagelliforme]|uniref:uncharacterized protein n=1 Tax=Fusarium flagelliforme TaxID=2675880 RepID=UPI001E8D9E59|nr:uncharacterized protein B0J16DRAFT_410140 [Fusarium flagelliforme]KAH7198651.1 hypothetical protein B0J16DRAFT_410140 [Fusarium flagelliforme]
MPSFQGVQFAIITEPGSKKLPEFPLSNPSSQYVLPSTSGLFGQDCNGSNRFSLALQQAQKQCSRISVYIPSEPGTNFGIYYSIKRVTQPPPFFYFKIFMNGRNVANCGAESGVDGSGCMTHSLCIPSDRWKYKEDGALHTRNGIEARRFCFLPAENQSVAEEGGFIEAQVFRAKGRIRRLPVLEKHRNQETYGLGSPSGGLLDWPEDACYYDWILIDSKESPFVTFRFHYRTWSNLYQLSLAPRPNKPDDPSVQAQSKSVKNPGTEEGKDRSSSKKVSFAEPLSFELIEHLELDQVPPSKSQSQPSTQSSGLFENAPVIPPLSLSTRPLPEIPIKKPVAHEEAKPLPLAWTASSLSDISEETETSTAVTFPTRSDSLRGDNFRISECQTTESLLVLSLAEATANFAIQGLLTEELKDCDITEMEVAATKHEAKSSEHVPDVKAMVAKAELSIKTGWRMTDNGWTTGGA